MDILLIRHGQAVDEAPGCGDAGRWLTAKGRKATRRVARWLAKGPKRTPVVIWTSPLVRAVQSAEILAAEARIRGELRACQLLSPGHDPGDLVKLLAASAVEPGRHDGPLALVGHEPSLSLLAQALLGDVGVIALKKSGVLALTWAPEEALPGGDAPHAKLWFVLDPARMKSRKTLAERPSKGDGHEPPPSAPR